ncbi:hypothetical protein BBP40_011509 [Aspergillus hancockii]|nr:hypothetical protein BBP40_011509 [Aspergillus hancockii]
MNAITRQNILRSADQRPHHKVGSNMPVAALNDDAVRSSGKLTAEPKDIYYRPFYSIADWHITCNNWIALYRTTDFSKSYEIDLRGVYEKKGAALGHPQLDQATGEHLSDQQLDIFDKLEFSITFNGDPVVVDVDRGLWDVQPLRRGMGSSVDDPPSEVHEKFCKNHTTSAHVELRKSISTYPLA